jgi:hypothetical protein
MVCYIEFFSHCNILVIWMLAIIHILFSRLNFLVTSRMFSTFICLAGFSLLPVTLASPVQAPFPDIPFKQFSQFILQNFSSKISLSMALVILFSLTENPDLLNLHARRQYIKCQGENKNQTSGWIKALARALKKQIVEHQKRPLVMKNVEKGLNDEQEITALGVKLDSLSKVLGLHPFDSEGKFQGKLQSISHKLIQPAYIICPDTMECQTLECKS